MRTIVAIGAHHDDIELRSGGTLAKYVRQGWRVVYVVASTTPHYYPWPDELASGKYRSNREIINLRKAESRRGAARLGISEVHFFDFKSLYWYRQGTFERRYLDGHETTVEEFQHLAGQLPGREFIVTASRCPAAIQLVSDFLTEQQAGIVLTHFPDDAHWEHYATANLVCSSVRQLLEAGTEINLFAWEQGGEGNLTTSFAPSNFVDITDTIEQKCASLMSFVSQFPDHNPQMFADRARKKAREYGKLSGMEYAEPFMRFEVPASCQQELQLAKTYNPSLADREL